MNGFFRQRRSKLPTFFGPNKRITHLDWIICPFYQKSRARNIRNIRPCCVNSDHSLLLCESDLRWQSLKRTPLHSDHSGTRSKTARQKRHSSESFELLLFPRRTSLLMSSPKLFCQLPALFLSGGQIRREPLLPTIQKLFKQGNSSKEPPPGTVSTAIKPRQLETI